MTKKESSALERLADLSESKTRLLEVLLERRSAHTQRISPLPRVAGETLRFPTSGAQQRLWLVDRMEGGSAAYHIPVALRLHGDLDRAAMRAALDALVMRHEALRTVFPAVGGEPVQQVLPQASFSLETVDLTARTKEQADADLAWHSREELVVAFDLSCGPLIRGKLLQLSTDEHVLLITMHHIVSDGWSMGILMRELGLLYSSHLKGLPDPLPPLPIQYADYACWQRQWLAGTQLQSQLNYWQEHLQGAPQLLQLPTDWPRPAVRSYRGAVAGVAVDAELTNELRALARRQSLTLAMVLHAAWVVVLSRLSGQSDIVIGVPVANRRRTELEMLIGFFVNTLAVRVQLDGDPTLSELLERVKEVLLNAYANQDAPFERVVEALQPERSLSHSPVFQAMLVMHNAPRHEMKTGLRLVEQEVPLLAAKFDLTLSLHESAGGIVGGINYATDLFAKESVERWIAYLLAVLRAMVFRPWQSVTGLELMSALERQQVIDLFNATQVDYPDSTLLHELFERQVERTPHAAAVVDGRGALTFAELNSRANQLARHLRERGVGPDQPVALFLERSGDMVVALLGVLKAGAAYLPLDPDYPAGRVADVLADAAPRALLIHERLREKLPATVVEVIALDEHWSTIARHPDTNLDARALGLRSDHLAYVIYTSGSTGRPKGVMVEHRNVASLWQGLEDIYRQSRPCQRVAVNASITFDGSVKQLIQMLSGRTVVVIPTECRADAARLLNFIDEQRIDAIDCTPSQLQSWLSAGLLDRVDGHVLSVVLVGGEPIDGKLWRRLAQSAETDFYNVYGPTESTVDTTFARLRGDATPAHIGRPMQNRRVYLLDRHGHPVPLGVVGEVYIGGAGVARGYAHRAQLTQERFLADPRAACPSARMYRSGDLARWRPDGMLEYVGRNDFQVKIRGFRIELGEIEAQLLRHESVNAAAVVAREDVPGDKRLVAYVVPSDASRAPTVEELRNHLRVTLPEYMTPSALVVMAELPRTSNGKLDLRALSAPDLDAYIARRYEAPRGELEEILAGIWQSLLHVERVGRHDNFFELGGHSLLIVQMMDRMRRFGLSTDVRRVFDSPTLADLASTLSSVGAGPQEVPPNLISPASESITPQMLPLVELQESHIDCIVRSVPGGASNIQDIYPLAPLQEGILYHHLLDERGGDTYVVPILLSVASRSRLEELIAALQAVVDRHDILRTAVLWEQLPQPVQVVYRRARLPVEELALDSSRALSEQLRDWMRPERQRLDPRRAPMLRLQVAAGPSGEWYALLQTHHVTSDHVTLEIVTSEVVAHLEGRAHEAPGSVPYRNHVAQALTYARTHDAEAFFRGKLADVNEPTAPFGLVDAHSDASCMEQACSRIGDELASRIRTNARRFAVSAATIFHAAWGLVVAHTSGRDDVVFGTVLLGRLQGSAGAQRVLGMFINTLPLRLQLCGLTAQELVEHTQRELVELLTHEQSSLAVAQRCSGVAGSVPLFTALFNYRHSSADPGTQWSKAAGIHMLAGQDWTNYPITFSVDDQGEGFAFTAQTDRRIDANRVIGYVHMAVQSLIEALEQAPQQQALRLSILSQAERAQVVETFNATQTLEQHDKLVHQLFEAQVLRTPDATAVMHGSRSYSYDQLNRRANRLARLLLRAGLRPDDLVAICVERSLDMVVGLLGILKAGAAYMPLDPSYPVERLRYMLEDAAPAIVVTQPGLKAIVPSTTVPQVELSEQLVGLVGDDFEQNVDPAALGLNLDNLVYVIYTSGSTGRPKGTAMPHRSMVNLLRWHRRDLPITPGRRVLQFAALSFDVAFQEIFSTLSAGATLVLVDEWVRRDAQALTELLSRQQVERLFVPPLMLQSLAEYFSATGHGPRSLKAIITAGEQLRISPEIVRFFRQLDECRLHNHYGPTETHVVTALTLPESPDEWPLLPAIGRPIANTRIYILDTRGQPVPVGVTGEIFISGANVARGYRDRPELTAQRFVANPWRTDQDARMYRTGDLGRWQADGTIQYLGRNDDQVKIRGYRIELAEIEAQLARHRHVREAAVVVREHASGVKGLVAYVTPREQGTLNIEELRLHVKQGLPGFMVPSTFVVLEHMPLTPSGKLNRRALPAPQADDCVAQQYDPPQGPLEETVARIWRELLSLARIGRGDNFFDIGGHSLLVLKLLFRVNESLGVTLKVADVYKCPTIQQLAARLAGAAPDDEFVDLSREASLTDDIVGAAGSPALPASAILFTGGTGFVGRFLLAELAHTTDATLYCLVRGASPQQALDRLRASLSKWDLWREDLERRIVIVPGDLRSPRLGLDDLTYHTLTQTVDSIYHCATSMNHLETYAMAKAANVDSARELLKLATLGKPKLINYVSTLGVFGVPIAGMTRVVNELSSIDREQHRNSRGYVASKWVGEKIFMIACERGIPCNIFRVGLVWGDAQHGRYDELQRGYRLLKSCLLSGCGIENYRFEMSPVPVDYVARAVSALADRHPRGNGIFHVGASASAIGDVFERCNDVVGTSLELMPFYEWIHCMQRLHQQGRSMPIVPLIDYAFSMDEAAFYEYQQRIRTGIHFDCERTGRVLARAGIEAPLLTDDLLKLCVQNMLARDPQLREAPNLANLRGHAARASRAGLGASRTRDR